MQYQEEKKNIAIGSGDWIFLLHIVCEHFQFSMNANKSALICNALNY